MKLFDTLQPGDIDRREMQLTTFACLAIGVLALGTAALMYPAVFSREAPDDKPLRIAFIGFCVLCVLLAGYLWDRQKTIQRLRLQMFEQTRRIAETQREASAELLKTLPNLAAFRDRLAMEFRRTAATSQKLSVLVILVRLPPDGATLIESSVLLGDAAKAASRKLREQDSLYLLGPACFGAVLPGVENAAAKRVRERLADGLADAAGASHRFSSDISVVNYPEDASSAHAIEQLVLGLVPDEMPLHGEPQTIVH